MELDLARNHARTYVPDRRLALLTAIGPLTVLVGVVWAIAQPYRLTLLSDTRLGVWEHLAQAPILVSGAGLLFWILVARPLAGVLRGES